MLPFYKTEYIFSSAILFLIIGVHPIIVFTPSNACDQKSDCLLIGQCNPYKSLPNWRVVGKSCNNRSGNHRRVCCPKSSEMTQEVSSRKPTVILPGCGKSNVANPTTGFVMGGENATEGEFPWMVAIMKRERGRYVLWCAGSLIDRKHVLSAAHCFETKKPSRYQARIGSVDLNTGEVYLIHRLVSHKGYTRGKFYDDLAVLTLDREVNFDGFNPICLPDLSAIHKTVEGQGTTVAGWGAEKERGDSTRWLKQLSLIPIISNSQCNQVFHDKVPDYMTKFNRGFNSGFICAGFLQGGKDSCSGDSGGPLMLQVRGRWFAIGVVSFGYRCGVRGIPGGYIRVSEYLNWIENKTSN